MAGQRQEHVVERRSAERQIIDAEPASLRRVTASTIAPLRSRTLSLTTSPSTRRFIATWSQRSHGRLDVGAVLERDLEALAADPVLELVGGALGDHRTVVDHRDRVGQAVGLVEVLRRQQHGRALGHQALDHLPQAQPAARVEAGRRLVEEQHRRLGDERGREVEPAPHAARVGLRRPLGGVDEVEALEQLAAAGLRRAPAAAVQPPDHRQVLEAGQVFVDRRVLAREPDPLAQPRRRRGRRRVRRPRGPASGFSSVVRMRTSVVLPAPLGPSRPSTSPPATSRSTPASAWTSPNAFDRSADADR